MDDGAGLPSLILNFSLKSLLLLCLSIYLFNYYYILSKNDIKNCNVLGSCKSLPLPTLVSFPRCHVDTLI